MENKQRIIDAIKYKVETEYKDDVAILGVYGSHISGAADKWSDVDFFFVPKTDSALRLSYQFIIEGIGYDLFPIRWERLLKIAAFDQPLTAVITESEVIYAATKEDLSRYEALRTNMLKLCTEEGAQLMLNKSYEYFNETYIYLYNMKANNLRLIDLKIEASKVISKIVMAAAFANHTYFKRGMGKSLSDSFDLPKLPTDYKTLIEQIVETDDEDILISATEALIQNTRNFLQQETEQYAQKEPFDTLFVGYYEELKSVINKMYRACDQQDVMTAFTVAAYFHEEISQFMTKVEKGIWFTDRNYYSEYSETFERVFNIDFMALVSSGDFEALKNAVIAFDETFVNLLHKHGMTLATFSTIDEFVEAYKSR